MISELEKGCFTFCVLITLIFHDKAKQCILLNTSCKMLLIQLFSGKTIMILNFLLTKDVSTLVDKEIFILILRSSLAHARFLLLTLSVFWALILTRINFSASYFTFKSQMLKATEYIKSCI